jgi:hypothetical protein
MGSGFSLLPRLASTPQVPGARIGSQKCKHAKTELFSVTGEGNMRKVKVCIAPIHPTVSAYRILALGFCVYLLFLALVERRQQVLYMKITIRQALTHHQ